VAEHKTLEYRYAEAQHMLRTLNAEMQRLMLTCDDPNDPALVELDEKITTAQKVIRRLEMLIANKDKALTAEQHAALKAKRRTAAKKVAALAQSRVALASKLDAEFAKIGELLAEWQGLGKDCRATFGEVHRPSTDFDYVALDYAAGSNGGLCNALVSVLQTAGLGEKGIPLAQQFVLPRDMRQTLTEAATYNAEKLKAMLQAHRYGHGDITLNDAFDKE